MRRKLLKPLFLAAALLIGTSAWADTETRYLLQETFDDQTASSWTPEDNTVSYVQSTGDDYFVKFYNSKSGNRAFYRDINVDFSNAKNGYTIEFDFSMWYGKRVSQGSTEYKQTQITLNAGTSILFQIGSEDTSAGDENEKKLLVNGTATNLIFVEGTWYHFVIDITSSAATYTITSNNGEDIFTSGNKDISGFANTALTKFEVINGRNGTVQLDNFEISYEADANSASAPNIVLSGVKGTERTFTITANSELETIYYSFDNETYIKADNQNGTVAVVTIDDANIKKLYSRTQIEDGIPSSATSIDVNCKEIALNTPIISRSATSVTITSDQKDVEGSPNASIYYTYGGDPILYKDPIPVTADANIIAYAVCDGYLNSETVKRAVALFPTKGVTQVENSKTPTGTNYNPSYNELTWKGSEITTEKATYDLALLDGKQFGNNVYFQIPPTNPNTNSWGFRNSGTWYVNSTSGVWMLMKNMKAGDIIITDFSKGASETVNATYSEKYTYDSNFAYIVDADGDVELKFARIDNKTNNYFYGIYAYTHNLSGIRVGSYDNTTEFMGDISERVILKPGDTYAYEFINYNSGGNSNWNNFVVPVFNSNDEQMIVIRADNFETQAWSSNGFNNNFNWDNFAKKMNGAKVFMTVNYSENNVFSMKSTIRNSEGSTWVYSYTSDYEGSSISLSGNIKVAMAVDYSWIDLISAGVSTVTTTLGADGYATFASPYALDLTSSSLLPQGVTAYKASVKSEENTVKFTKLDQYVPANTGILLEGSNGQTVNLSIAATATEVSGNDFKVNTTGQTFAASENYNYYGMKPNSELVFGLFDPTTVAIPANKAYLMVAKPTPSSPDAARLTVTFDGKTTGISTVEAVEAETEGVYNLNGQRIAVPQKGLYIVNGKKVIMK